MIIIRDKYIKEKNFDNVPVYAMELFHTIKDNGYYCKWDRGDLIATCTIEEFNKIMCRINFESGMKTLAEYCLVENAVIEEVYTKQEALNRLENIKTDLKAELKQLVEFDIEEAKFNEGYICAIEYITGIIERIINI